MAIVRTTYRYPRPRRRRQAAALEVPAVVKAAEPAKASKRARSTKLAESAAPDAVPSGDRVAPPSVIITIRRRKHAMLAHLLEDMTPEEHRRRGDAADAMMREIKRQIAERRR
jgi:hypothetical protein